MVWACKLLFEHTRWTAAPSEPQSGMPQPLLPAHTTNSLSCTWRPVCARCRTGTHRSESGWQPIGPWLANPRLGTINCKQGLDRRHLPDRCRIS